MNALRNLFMAALTISVVAVVTYAIKPDLFKQATAAGELNKSSGNSKATLLIPSNPKASPTGVDAASLLDIVDSDGEGIPSKTSPYIMIVNSIDKRIRHLRLTARVSSVTIKNKSSDVEFRTSRSTNPSAPLQVEIWTLGERELLLDVEYSSSK
jgi:hypothetical protein